MQKYIDVTNLNLPEVDGFQVLDALRRDPMYKQLPVIVVTGRVLDASEEAVLRERASSILHKGEHNRRMLLDALDRVMGTSEEEKAR